MLIELIKTVKGKTLKLLAEKSWVQELLKDDRVKLVVKEVNEVVYPENEKVERPKRNK